MKAEKERERAADIARQEEENKVGARQVEHVAIMARLTARGLTLHQVSAARSFSCSIRLLVWWKKFTELVGTGTVS